MDRRFPPRPGIVPPDLSEVALEWPAFKDAVVGMEERLKRLEKASVDAPRAKMASIEDLTQAVERFEEAAEVITSSHNIPPPGATPSIRVAKEIEGALTRAEVKRLAAQNALWWKVALMVFAAIVGTLFATGHVR